MGSDKSAQPFKKNNKYSSIEAWDYIKTRLEAKCSSSLTDNQASMR